MNRDTQLAFVNGEAITERGVFDTIDTVLSELYQTGNTDQVFGAITTMDKIGRVSGLAKAKLLWGTKQWWEQTNQTETRGDEFVDAVEAETGTTPITVRRYVTTWGYIEDCVIPKEVQGRRMDDLIKIASTLEQGYEFTRDNWKALQKAANSSEVGEILRTVKGKPPRKSGKQIVLERDGSLAVIKQGKRYSVGYLDVSSDEEVVQQVIRLIVNALQIQEK
jgi:hypothetical protein